MLISSRPIRHGIERLSPYQSLALLAVPVGLIEPLKLVAVAIAGEGRWITGAAMIIAAYLGSLFVVESTVSDRKAEAVDASVVREALGKIRAAQTALARVTLPERGRL